MESFYRYRNLQEIKRKGLQPAASSGIFMNKKFLKYFLSGIFIILFLGILLLILYLNGFIQFNHISKEEYPVQGIDVSSYQGKINWEKLSKQVDFVYIKATEGSNSVDSRFSENYAHALKTDIRVGAYHFFSYDSAGKTQAENFISHVKKAESMLPPVIDVEFYGDKEKSPPSRSDVQKELKIMLDMLEEYYQTKPVLYCTQKSYQMFISGDYQEYDIWIRDVLKKPLLNDGRQWTFWQYSEKGLLDGYQGEEKFIDLNVFNGTKEEFLNYGINPRKSEILSDFGGYFLAESHTEKLF